MNTIPVPTTPPRKPHRTSRRAYVATFDPSNPPPRVDRQAGAALLFTVLGVRVSPRTLESWPLATRLVNGRATYTTAELLDHGRKLLDGSPSVRGGRTRKAHS